MLELFQKTSATFQPDQALPGRPEPMTVTEAHFVSGLSLTDTVPAGMVQAMFGMGCFWGVERLFWETSGIYLSMVGYAGGITPNPPYKETCTQLTGHNEVVRVIFDPTKLSYSDLLQIFWENHDPTQGMRQGNDVGSTYRSGIYCYDQAQIGQALDSKATYQAALLSAGHGVITTEILEVPKFYYAEDYHQQYLAKNPNGYCGLQGTGVICPIGTGVPAQDGRSLDVGGNGL